MANRCIRTRDCGGAQSFTVTKKAGEVSENNQIRIVNGSGRVICFALEYFTGDDEITASIVKI